MAVNPETFKAVMGQWPSGVTVVTSIDGDGPVGMTASSFSSVSLEPPLVSVCIARHLATHERLEKAGVFAVNILSKNQVQEGLRFAGMLPDVSDRFDGVDVSRAATGSPLLANSMGWVDCKIWAIHDGGDHSIFVGEVLAADIDKTASPLLYHSRSWGQFADVLANEAHVNATGTESDALVIDNAFGDNSAQPADLEEIVQRIQESLAGKEPGLLVLDDAANAADPVLLRLCAQALGSLLGRTAVALRPGKGPMALANVLVGLKSGIHHFSCSSDSNGPYVAEADLRAMLNRMGVYVAQ